MRPTSRLGEFVMRRPRSPAWARLVLSAAAVLLAVAGLGPSAAADEKYTQLFVFGDSYADLTLSDKPASNLLAPPGLGLSLWRVYPIPLAAKLGMSRIVDVAVGGATASPFGTTSPFITPPAIAPGNLPAQVDGFFATNPSFTFGPRDLVTINIGGNDIRGILDNSFFKMDPAANEAFGYPKALLNPLNAKSFADQTAPSPRAG